MLRIGYTEDAFELHDATMKYKKSTVKGRKATEASGSKGRMQVRCIKIKTSLKFELHSLYQ